MPVSVTCQCGSRLEIDEKFLGKEVLCPDCQRPLPTKAPPTPPPLALPENRRYSGLAILSLTLALVGAFLPPLTIAAVVVGVLALREIASHPARLEGTRHARAGIFLGALFTILSPILLIYSFNLDVLMRELAFANRLVYSSNEVVKDEDDVEIKRPSAEWRKFKSPNQQSQDVQGDAIILVNIGEDAYIACQNIEFGDDAENRNKVVERFARSELASLINRSRGKNDNVPRIEEPKGGAEAPPEVVFDIRLGGIERRCLAQYTTNKADGRIHIVVGCARKSQFERLEKDFRKAFENFKAKPL